MKSLILVLLFLAFLVVTTEVSASRQYSEQYGGLEYGGANAAKARARAARAKAAANLRKNKYRNKYRNKLNNKNRHNNNNKNKGKNEAMQKQNNWKNGNAKGNAENATANADTGNNANATANADTGNNANATAKADTGNNANATAKADTGNNANATAQAGSASALFFLSNDPTGNKVVALKIDTATGKVSEPVQIDTGGKGGIGVVATGAQGPDPLFSQGSLKVGGDFLFAVNAGSNTLSMFNIDKANPTKLKLVGKPVDTLGEFPVSVTFSAKLGQACVANGGAKDGVACFKADAVKGLTPVDKVARKFNIGQTTPPKGPTGTVSHALFNGDESALLVTVKGDPPTKKQGFLASFAVAQGAVSDQAVKSSPNGTAVLFGSTNIGNGQLLATDAAFGAAILNLNVKGEATLMSTTTIDGQKATCWASFSSLTKTSFVTDVAVNHVVEIDNSGKIVGNFNLTDGGSGLIDSAIPKNGQFFYALSPNDQSVVVLNLQGGPGTAKEIQKLNVAGISASVQGMTIFD